jgi:ankyrin repeat protein
VTAVVHGNHEVIRVLLEAHSDIEARDNRGQTPLFHAASRDYPENRVETMQLLFDYGAKINVSDSSGDTLLHFACSTWHPDSVKWLVDHGAIINAKNRGGQTPLQLCQQVRNWEFVKQHYAALDQIMAILTEHGASN